VLPVEDEHNGDIEAAGGDDVRTVLQKAAKAADIASTRALLTRACWELDQGTRALTATSIAKTHASEAIFRIVDRSTQMCGGLGVSEDLPLARLTREVRSFRIYDGPSEVHRWSIAKRVVSAAKRTAEEQK